MFSITRFVKKTAFKFVFTIYLSRFEEFNVPVSERNMHHITQGKKKMLRKKKHVCAKTTFNNINQITTMYSIINKNKHVRGLSGILLIIYK